jgi:hypothetical protein
VKKDKDFLVSSGSVWNKKWVLKNKNPVFLMLSGRSWKNKRQFLATPGSTEKKNKDFLTPSGSLYFG